MSGGAVELPSGIAGIWVFGLPGGSSEHRVGMSPFAGREIHILGQPLCGHLGLKIGSLSSGAALLLVMVILHLFWPGARARAVSEARYILVGMMASTLHRICWSKDVRVGELVFVDFC